VGRPQHRAVDTDQQHRRGPLQGLPGRVLHALPQILALLDMERHAQLVSEGGKQGIIGIRGTPAFQPGHPGSGQKPDQPRQQLAVDGTGAHGPEPGDQPGLHRARTRGLGENQEPGVGELHTR